MSTRKSGLFQQPAKALALPWIRFLVRLLLVAGAFALLRTAFAAEEQERACLVEFRAGASFEGTLAVRDPLASDLREIVPARKIGRVGSLRVPARPLLFVWSNSAADAGASLLDLTGETRRELMPPPIKHSRGVLLLRMTKTRSASKLDLSKMRLRAGQIEASAPLLWQDLLIFNDVPKRTRLRLVAPPEGCLGGALLAGLGRLSWDLLRAELSLCSELRVLISGLEEPRDLPSLLRLRERSDTEAAQESVLERPREVRFETLRPITFDKVSPGSYEVELEVPARRLKLSEILTVPVETRLEHSLDIRSIRVTGRVTWGGSPGSGELAFLNTAREEKLEVRVEAALDDDGGYEIWLPGPGGYYVEMKPQNGVSGRGPGMIHEIPDRKEYVLDLSFPRTLIWGRVVDTEGKPVPDAQVTAHVRYEDGESGGKSRTDSAGSFRLLTLTEGVVTLTARRNGYRPQGELPSFPLRDGDELERNIVLQKFRSAEITIELPNGEPLSGTFVECRSRDSPAGCWLAGQSDEKGIVEVNVQQGLPLACFFASPVGSLGAFDVTSASPTVWRVPQLSANLTVHFQDEEGKPVRSREVRVRVNGRLVCPETLSLHVYPRGGWDASKPDGRVRLTGLPTGAVEVYILRSADSERHALTGSGLDRIVELPLAPGDDRTVVVTLKRREASGRPY